MARCSRPAVVGTAVVGAALGASFSDVLRAALGMAEFV
jgi:hypothetical protein